MRRCALCLPVLFALGCRFDPDFGSEYLRCGEGCPDHCTCVAGQVCVPVAEGADPAACLCAQDADCDDGMACTLDRCDPMQGCVLEPMAAGSHCGPCQACDPDGVCAPLPEGSLKDSDGDGDFDVACGTGTDCDDGDAAVYLGAPEDCDGKDNDCDGQTDEFVYTYAWTVEVQETALGEPLRGFPVLIRIEGDQELTSVAGGQEGKVRHARGWDIVFTQGGTDSCEALLPYEIEHYDPGSGTLAAWVRLERLDPLDESSRRFFLLLGRDNAPMLQRPERVWAAEYTAVYHMGPSGEQIADSTGRGHLAAAVGTRSPDPISDGIAGPAARFEADARQAFEVEHAEDLDLEDDFTLETWVRVPQSVLVASDASGEWQALSHHRHNDPAIGYALLLKRPQSDHAHIELRGYNEAGDERRFLIAREHGMGIDWHHLAGVFHLPTMQLYLDGELLCEFDDRSFGVGWSADTPLPLRIGNAVQGGFWFQGDIDELRISHAARSESWLRAHVANLTQDGFLIVGRPAESGGGDLP
ncbi:MAG: hypothetical protein JXR96_20180 [Deltaproteobacteria bacterium]|nr:hypothetical protein [Deltaproteobacteria bacterium]